jgi:transmembrane sensor
MNYYQFNAEDFAADDYFKEWVCTPDIASDAFWKQFLKEYPERYYALEEGRILVESLQQINVTDHSEQADRIWRRIDGTVAEEKSVKFFGSMSAKGLAWRIAASAALLVGVFAGLWQGGFLSGKPDLAALKNTSDWQETFNNSEKPMRLQLMDGSKVILEKSSSIRHAKVFSGQSREVYLKGEAFFDVTKDPSKPFLVYANGLVTKVLGTSFNIQARENDPDVTVSVKTGRVSVYSGKSAEKQDPEAKGIVLSPNQKAVFQKEMATLTKTLVDKPVIVLEKNNLPSFVFEDAPAAKVFETLEKVYGIDVVFDEEIMKNCTLTIDLNEEDLFQKLEVICKVLEAQYKLIDAQVIIYSKGC